MKLNEKLVKLRKSKNLTQQQVAREINYSDKVISKWENGYSCPDLHAIVKLADFFNISIEELIGDCEEPIVNENKKFPLLAQILFHILLIFIPILIITNILCIFIPKNSVKVIISWDSILPITLGIFLIILTIIDLVLVYKKLSRKIIIILIFSLVCIMFLFCLIAFIMYGETTFLTFPFIYLIVSILICTAFGFLYNKKC